jgi:hypothetical protein
VAANSTRIKINERRAISFVLFIYVSLPARMTVG